MGLEKCPVTLDFTPCDRPFFQTLLNAYSQTVSTVKPFNLAALNFNVLPSVDILAALKFSVFIVCPCNSIYMF